MTEVRTGWYDFLKCPTCKKPFAILQLENRENEYWCPYCGSWVDPEEHYTGQELVESK